jgi:hypothetical protein
MARPSLFTDLVTDKILNALRRGATNEVAARLAGIHPRTLQNWLVSSDPELKDFAVQVEQVKANAELDLIEEIRSNPDFRAKGKILDALNKNYRNTIRVEKVFEEEIAELTEFLQTKLSNTAFQEYIQALSQFNTQSLPNAIS